MVGGRQRTKNELPRGHRSRHVIGGEVDGHDIFGGAARDVQSQGESAEVHGGRQKIVSAFQMQAVLKFVGRRSEHAWRSIAEIVALDTAS